MMSQRLCLYTAAVMTSPIRTFLLFYEFLILIGRR